MRRTEQLQGLRLMKFEEVYGRSYRGELSQVEASEILGVSERTFRRWRDRYQAEGAEGLYDRRLGRASARRAGVDEVLDVLALFDTRYWDFTAKHFWEKLVDEHGVTRSYNWLRTTLQAHGRIKPAPRRGAHRRKRPRRPVVGMMFHQDASSHAWVAGEMWDLVVTLDDATSEVYSGFFVAEEGTMSSFQALSEVIAGAGPVLLALCRSGGALLAHAEGRRQGRQGQSDPGGPGASAARHRADRGLFAGGAGALGAHVRDLAEALAPGAAPGPGSPPDKTPTASSRRSSGRPTTRALPGRLRRRARPSWPLPAISPTSSRSRRSVWSRATTRCAIRTAASRSRPTATAITTSRQGCACTNIPTAIWRSSTDPGAWPATRPRAS